MMDTTEQKVAALKEATRAANEVLGDLKRTIAEGRKLLSTDVKAALESELHPVIKNSLQEWSEAVNTAVERSTQQVYDRFDKIGELLMGEDKATRKRGEPSLQDIATAHALVDGVITTRDIQ